MRRAGRLHYEPSLYIRCEHQKSSRRCPRRSRPARRPTAGAVVADADADADGAASAPAPPDGPSDDDGLPPLLQRWPGPLAAAVLCDGDDETREPKPSARVAAGGRVAASTDFRAVESEE